MILPSTLNGISPFSVDDIVLLTTLLMIGVVRPGLELLTGSSSLEMLAWPVWDIVVTVPRSWLSRGGSLKPFILLFVSLSGKKSSSGVCGDVTW